MGVGTVDGRRVMASVPVSVTTDAALTRCVLHGVARRYVDQMDISSSLC
ncbi:hypothetical protein HUF15_18395 [Streptomyces samsunensis]|uniref:Uncharacterized protein n=3 Tax=Streptomyces malaysiensis TaxID=92644 RepID=A0ABX6WK59_STRMQ|nr:MULTISPECIES: hypothetical protein [Streptomyces]MYU13273.1 hypothetical protein [Streptomyces sp. SID8361]AUA08518.1 hypothetical protein CFP59_00604 [Streptomyces sp. M56]MCC4315248.1 hypothetical protein [Streptomyces malaysiensis]MCD9587086.1 hypothetical protein [Streptomyces sp. 8ZJF_21]MCM3807274.1 hypothetical protein [Streptomyces sp. DR7-3]